MAEYRLSPDQLIAKAFRLFRSSRPGFSPHGKSDWIAAIRQIDRKNNNDSPKYLQTKHNHIYTQARWIFGDFDKALSAAGFDPARMRARVYWDKNKIIAAIRRLRKQKLPLYNRRAKPARTMRGNIASALVVFIFTSFRIFSVVFEITIRMPTMHVRQDHVKVSAPHMELDFPGQEQNNQNDEHVK